MNENPLITIIVPVYNTKKYLKRCVDSLLSQSYTNLEIILIDDGSSDGSEQMCDDFAQKDQRIQSLHKANGGLSSARNYALDRMTGKYVSFVDSDDFVSNIYVEKLYELIEKYNADISVCDENRFKEGGDGILWEGSPYKQITKDIVLSSSDGLDTYMRQILYDASACMKMYKSNLFDGIRYPEGYNYEDVGTTYKLYCKANTTAFTPQRLYYYFQREGSILHVQNQTKLLKNLKDGIKMSEEQRSFVVNQFPQLLDAADSRCFSMYCRLVGLIDARMSPELCDYCWEKIVILRKKFLFHTRYRKKVRMAALISFLGRKVYIKVYRIISRGNNQGRI